LRVDLLFMTITLINYIAIADISDQSPVRGLIFYLTDFGLTDGLTYSKLK